MYAINPGTVLIIDDNHNNISVLSTLLSTYNYNVIGALNGEKGITMALNRMPDLILLDIMMPGMDGYQVCSELKNKEETKNIPIIFITALNEIKSVLKAFQYGAADYIVKPFEEAEVIARVKAHSQNVILKKKLEEKAREMEQFAYHAAHDLKSPINIFSGFVSLLKNDEKFKDNSHLGKIEKTAIKLRKLVDSLLGLADTTQRILEFEEIDLENLIEEVKSEFIESLEQKNARIIIENNIQFVADRTQMIILFRNLISNALKYSKEEVPPQITIDANINDMVRINVNDNGLGFKPDKAKEMFDPFIRLHTNVDGHGLGLSICSKIIEIHHGSISADSQPGEGSVFKIEIPKDLDQN